MCSNETSGWEEWTDFFSNAFDVTLGWEVPFPARRTACSTMLLVFLRFSQWLIGREIIGIDDQKLTITVFFILFKSLNIKKAAKCFSPAVETKRLLWPTLALNNLTVLKSPSKTDREVTIRVWFIPSKAVIQIYTYSSLTYSTSGSEFRTFPRFWRTSLLNVRTTFTIC